MSDLWALTIIVGAVVARTGGLLLSASAGRARCAGTAAWRSFAEMALITVLATLLCTYALPHLTAIDIPTGASLAGTLLGAVVLGAAAGERSTTRVGLVLAAAYAAVVIPAAYLAVPYLSEHNFLDRAGMSIYVLTAGVMSLVAAAVVGPRSGRFARDGSISVIPPHQLPLLFASLLVVGAGWIIVAACLAGARATGGLSLLLAMSSGVLAAAAYSRWRFGRTDVGLLVPAVFGSLSSVSVGLGVWSEWQAILAGALGAVASVWLHLLLERKLKLDDVTGAAAAQVAGAALGVLLAGVLPIPMTTPLATIAAQLGVQFFALALFALIALVVSCAVLIPLKWLSTVRLHEDIEYDGLDLATLDLNAYPDFQQPMIRSSHMREL